MEFLTLILVTSLTVFLYFWKLRWHRGLLCDKRPPAPDTLVVTAPNTEDLGAWRDSALPEEQGTIWQTEGKMRTLGVSLRFLGGEERDCAATTTMLSPDDTVAEAKRKLAVEGQRLIFAGKPLDDSKMLKDCGIKDGVALYSAPPETVSFQVRSITGRTLALRCDVQDRVATLRMMVEAVLGITGRHLTLVLRGQELNSSMTLRESGLQDGDIVHLVMRFWGGDDVAGRITVQCGLEIREESWGDAVIEQAMRALYLADSKHNITRGESSNDKGKGYIEKNVVEGFRFEMAYSTIVLVVLVLEEPYLLQLECSWTVDQAKDLLQNALGISVPQEWRFYHCEKELSDFYGIKDGDFVELCSRRI